MKLTTKAFKVFILTSFLGGILISGNISLPVYASDQSQHLVRQAPEWQAVEWLNSEPFALEDLKGKVVILEFFQLWCPGCNEFSIPLMKKWYERYQDNPQIQLISIHSVFEGMAHQTPEKLRQFVKDKGILHPVAIDKHTPDHHIPITMRLYESQGTPEMVIIDKEGYIRVQQFGIFAAEEAEAIIEALLLE